MITHVFDTSAVLAHYFNEPGADEVERIWQDHRNEIGLSALSVTELRGRLGALVSDRGEVERAMRLYTEEITTVLAVDRNVARRAADLRETARVRLPLVDAVIAATAGVSSAILVHRDPHYAALGAAADAPQQLVLPDRL
ncbi:MAG TPA: PIN domain-containing protein [Opitutaceae bacterium]